MTLTFWITVYLVIALGTGQFLIHVWKIYGPDSEIDSAAAKFVVIAGGVLWPLFWGLYLVWKKEQP